MSADERWKGKRLGTALSYRRIFIVRDPQDSAGTTVEPQFDSELLTKAAFGTSLVGLPFAMAQQPRIVETIGTTSIVEVPYEAPSGLQGSGVGSEGWQVRISGGLDSIRVDTERLTLAEKEEGLKPRIVGPFAYMRKTDPLPRWSPAGNAWSHYKAGTTELIFDVWAGERIPIGMDIMVPNASITFRRLCADNNPSRVNEVLYRLGYVNDDEVRLPGLGGYHFLPGQLLVQGFEASEVANAETGTYVHDISVTLAGNSEGWQFDYFDTWTDPNATGTAAAIVLYGPGPTDDDGNPVDDPTHIEGRPVKTRYRRQFEAPMNGWVESLS